MENKIKSRLEQEIDNYQSVFYTVNPIEVYRGLNDNKIKVKKSITDEYVLSYNESNKRYLLYESIVKFENGKYTIQHRVKYKFIPFFIFYLLIVLILLYLTNDIWSRLFLASLFITGTFSIIINYKRFKKKTEEYIIELSK